MTNKLFQIETHNVSDDEVSIEWFKSEWDYYKVFSFKRKSFEKWLQDEEKLVRTMAVTAHDPFTDSVTTDESDFTISLSDYWQEESSTIHDDIYEYCCIYFSKDMGIEESGIPNIIESLKK